MFENLQEDKLKKHYDLQWRTNMLMTKLSLDGSQQEKQRVIEDRIKKFHLYNTPELESHSKQETTLSTSMSLEQTTSIIDLDTYEKALIVTGIKPHDINYLGVLFKEHNVQFKDITTLPKNEGLKLYFNTSFDIVQKCLTRIQTPSASEKQKEFQWYKLKQIQGFDLVSPHVKARIIFQPKPGSSEYLLETSKTMFIKNETTKMQCQRFSRSRSRSRYSYSERSSSIESSDKDNFDNVLNNRRRFVFKDSKQKFKTQQNKDKPFVRHSIRPSIRCNRFNISKREY